MLNLIQFAMKNFTLLNVILFMIAGFVFSNTEIFAVNSMETFQSGRKDNPVVDFSASSNLIPAGNDISFTDLSTQSPTSWIWSFPGGMPTDYVGKIPPPVKYNSAGSYDVSLTVIYPDITITETKTAIITVSDYPAGWEIIQTGSSHLISIPNSVSFTSSALVYGDFIGVFYLDGAGIEKCGGANIWDGANNKAVVAFGDDATTTTVKDGFGAGEDFIWRVWSSANNANYFAIVTYNTALPSSDGKFVDNGLSSLLAINFPSFTPVAITASATPADICEGDPVQLDVTVTGGSGNYIYNWTSAPAGFASQLKNPITFPQTSTTYSVTVSDGFTQAIDGVMVTVTSPPSVDAGVEMTICENLTVQLSATAENFCEIQWTSEGDGLFNNPGLLNAVYTPGPTDIINGGAEICITAMACAPCSGEVSDCTTVEFVLLPIVDILTDEVTVCGNGSFDFTGNVIAENYLSIHWETGGDGTFSPDATSLAPVYNPGPGDILQGCVEITVSVDPLNPCNFIAEDSMELCFQLMPLVSAGDDIIICSTENIIVSTTVQNNCGILWETTGDGFFENSSLETTTYFPGSQDFQNGYVELCVKALPCEPCTEIVSDCLLIEFISPPTAALTIVESTICSTDLFDFAGLVDAGSYSSLEWSSTGDGIFSPNPNVLAPAYIPGNEDLMGGCIEILFIAFPNDPCSMSAEASMELCIQPMPQIDAGKDQLVCLGDPIPVVAAALNQCGIQWETTGDGQFVDPANLATSYIPGALDIENGFVELCVSAVPCEPCTDKTIGCFYLEFVKSPEVNILPDNIVICASDNFDFSGLVEAENYSDILWNTSGDGTFTYGEDLLEPIYLPGAEDIVNGCVQLSISAAPIDPCNLAAEDSMELCFQPLPAVDAGLDVTICSDDLVAVEATAQFHCGFYWGTSGTGFFDNPENLGVIYTPGEEDIAAGSVQLCLTVLPCEPCTNPVTDCLTVTFGQIQTITIPAGWSGISSVIEPFESDIEFIMSPAIQELIIMYNLEGQMLFPDGEINTIINWDRLSGYVIKTTGETQITLCGADPANNALQLTAGWNLIPVLNETDLPIADIFAPVMNQLVIIKEVAGVNLFYPEFGIATLNILESGKAYFVKVNEDCTITY